MRRALASLVLTAFAMLLANGAAEAQQRVLNVYNWSDYVDPVVLAEFTKKTGIKVRYDTFDTNDVLEAKLLAGRSGYDVVAPTGYLLDRLIKAKIVQPLDKSKLPNLVHLWPEISAQLAKYDPGNRHAVNYMWGTTGIGYNVGKALEVLGPEARIDSWSMVFRPEDLGRFKDCGIHMLDSAEDMLPAALRHLGLDPNSTSESEFQKAALALIAVRPLVRKFHASEYLNALATGEICFAVGFSGDVKQAQKRAAEGKKGIQIAYSIPKEGAQLWFDNLAIPRDSKNVAEAHEFINFLQIPEIAARNSNFISYANGNLASQKFMDKEVLEDRNIYPDAEMMSRLYTVRAHDPKTTRLLNRLWTRIKTGR
jgi:putrescine transport system substrate-binding protein